MPVSLWFRGRGLLFLALLIGRLHAQSGSLILAPASATPGAVVAVNLSLTSSTTSPAGLQWTLNYPASSITAVYATEGPAAISAGKSVSCASGVGNYTCLATGINSNTIPNGVVAVISLTLSPTAQSTILSLTATLGSTLDGSALPVSGTAAWITITPAAAPTFTPLAGNYATSQSVTLATTTAGAAIRYTTDGSTPSATAGTLYSGAITVNSTTTIKAIAYETGYTDSSVASATYTISSNGGLNWYNNSWSYRKALTISHTKVSGSSNLTNFPVSISLATDSDMAAHAQSTGNDILFTDSSGTNKLNHEIEAYNSTTGQLIAWVQVPSVSPATDTVIFMYYGNPSATDQQNKTLVWDANYQGIWHLPNGTALNATDSTFHGNNGTIGNATAAAGEIYGGASFNGSNASVDLGGGSGLHITGPITAQAWVNVTGWPANGYPAGLLGMGYNYASGWTGWMLEASTDNGGNHYLSWTSNNGATHGVARPSSLATGTWHQLVGTYDGSTWKMYLDGAANGSSVDATAPVNTGDDVVAGGLSTNGFGTIFPFNGLLDELRVSNTARSSDWIATEYNNQSNPANFLSVGAAQGSAGGGSGTVSITVATSPSGLAFAVDGTAYTAPQILQWVPGANHTITVIASPQSGGTGIQNVYASWSDGGSQSHSITVPSSVTTYTATFTTQYLLTTQASPVADGTISPASEWVNSGTPVQISATANSGYQFTGFTGGLTGTLAPQTLPAMTGPVTVTANFSVSSSGQAATPTFSPVSGTYSSAQTLTLGTTASGASIRYTTDGSAPTETAGTLYTGAVTVNSTTTIRAIAYEAGMNDSSIGSATYTILQTVAAPAFNPVAGTYTTAQSVTLATTTAGAAIRYTTDGSAPSETSGTLYNGPIPIKATTTLKAIAYATGMADSLIASGTYTITPLGPSWYNVAWTSRKPVTVDHTKVSGILGLANFPMLLSVTDTDLKWTAIGGRVGKADGTDILFTAGDGMTTLSHEIEAYNPNTGQLIAWVNIPLLNSTADTVVYVYFGNVSAGDQQNRRGVWDRDYGGVWHMSDNAANSTVSDSTVNGGNGTARASTNSKTEPGQIGSGLSFNGSTDFISMPNTPGVNIATNTNITMEAWVNVTTFTSPTQVLGYIIGKGYKEGAEAYFLLMENDSGMLHLKAGMDNNSAFAANWPISNWNPGEWHQVVGLWDGSSWTLYVDGVTKAQTSTGNGPLQMGLPLTLGAESISGTVAGLLACTLDEVRVSNVARSDAWIATQFRNQFSPGSFYTVGASQVAPQ